MKPKLFFSLAAILLTVLSTFAQELSNSTDATQAQTTSQTLCVNATVGSLQSTGNVQWFTSALGGTALSTSTVLTTGTYYVEETLPLTIENLGSGFSNPFGVAVESNGKILIADTGNNVIRRMNADGSGVVNVNYNFTNPTGVAVQSDGKILIADFGNNAIKRMNADGSGLVTLKSGINQPRGVAVLADGRIIYAETGSSRVMRMNANGTGATQLGGNNFSSPFSIAVQPDGKILVVDTGNNAIKRMNANGSGVTTLVSGLNQPRGVAVKSDGSIYFTDTNNNLIKGMNADGFNVVTVGSPINSPTGIAVQSDGKIVVANFSSNKVIRFNHTLKSRIPVSVSIVPFPPAVSIATASTPVCPNEILPITAILSPPNGVLLEEYFNAPTNNWVTANYSSGGNVNEGGWNLRPSGYPLLGSSIHLGSSQAYVANNFTQGALGSSNATLTSPSFSTMGYQEGTLYISHMYITREDSNYAMEYSIDGGTNWNSIGSLPSNNYFTIIHHAFNLPSAALNKTNVKIRFHYTAYFGYFWAIDGIALIGRTPTTWSPATHLYTDAAATIPYVLGTNSATVYAKSANSGTTMYTVTSSSGGSCTTATNFNFTVKSNAAPSASAQTFCRSATVGNLQATGINLKWYNLSTGGTALSAETGVASGTYYVSQTVDGCESLRKAVVITIKSLPSAPTGSSQSFCGSATVGNLVATGSAIKWYNSATDGTALSNSTALSTGNYYVSQTINGCESPREIISVTVQSIPSAPTASNQTFCVAATVANLIATGFNIKWYAAANGGSPLNSTTALTTATYYASQTINGCESARKNVIVTLYQLPVAPTASPQTYCGGSTVANLTATGTNLRWYAAANGGTPLNSTTTITSSTYYVSQTVNGCESTRKSVPVTVNVIPLPTATAQTLCEGATVANLIATGTDLKWYANATGGSALNATNALVTGTYYVTQTLTVTGCESLRKSVNVTVNPPLTVDVGPPTAFFCTNSNGTITATNSYETPLPIIITGFQGAYAVGNWNSAYSGDNYGNYGYIYTNDAPASFSIVLSNDYGFGSGLYSNSIFIPSATTISFKWEYWGADEEDIIISVNGVVTDLRSPAPFNETSGTQTLTLPAGSTLAFGINKHYTYHSGAASWLTFRNFTATTTPATIAGTTYSWAATNGGTISGSSTTATIIPATSGTYSVTATGVGGCTASDTVAVTVETVVPPVVITPLLLPQGISSTALTATSSGTGVLWYSTANGGTGSTTAPIPNTSIPGTTSYWVSSISLNSCESTRSEIAVTIQATPNATASTIQAFCGSATVAQLVATGTNLKWYSNAAGGTELNSNTNLISGIYYVSQTVNGFESDRTSVAVTVNSIVNITSTVGQTETCDSSISGVNISGGLSGVRYIRIKQNLTAAQSGALHLAELKAFEIFTGAEVAQGKTATASGAHYMNNPIYSVSKFTDGNLSTFYHSALPGETEWIEVDLGAAYNLDYIEIFRRTDCCRERHRDLQLIFKNDAGIEIHSKKIDISSPASSSITYNVLDVAWADGATTLNRTGLNDGTYTLTYTDVVGCEATHVKTVVVVKPNAPTVTSQTFCGSAKVANLTATGTDLKWYNLAIGGSALAATTALTSGNYYVSQTVNGCESLRKAVNVSISQMPTSLSPTLSNYSGPSNSFFTAYVSGLSSGLSFQWQKEINSSWVNISGATSASSVITAENALVGSSTNYRVKITCISSGAIAYSNSVSFTIAYCTVNQGDTGVFTLVSHVMFGGINNFVYNDIFYNDFTSISTTVYKETMYLFYLQELVNLDLPFVWIDFNQNGSFEDAGELVLNKSVGNITIPNSALSGPTRMRVRFDIYNNPNSSACGSIEGSVQDYTIIINRCPGVWTGATNTDWHTASNWCNNAVPTALSDVLIKNSVNQPLITTSTTIKSLEIESGAQLNTAATLTVSENISNNGQMIFKSTATATGQLGVFNGTISGSGTATVERYLPAKRAWRALTAPLKGTNGSIYSHWQNNGIQIPNVGAEIWGPSGTGMATGPNYSVLEYTPTGYVNVTNTQTKNLFDTNKNNAYLMFVTGAYGSGNITSTQAPTATTLKATGQLITGDVTYNGISNTKHKLIGNPYASALNPATLLNTTTNLIQKFWLWDSNLGSSGGYVMYDKTAQTYNNTTGSYPTGTTAVQSGQAFFVRATAGNSGSLTLNETNKSSAVTNSVFSTHQPEIFRLGMYRQEAENWLPLDGAIAVLYPSANSDVDEHDGKKFVNSSENIAFRRTNTSLSSEHRLPLTVNDTLFVKIWNTTPNLYKLKLNTEQFTTTGLTATLQDLYTNESTVLNLDGTATDYLFHVTTDAASSNERFRIVFQTENNLSNTKPIKNPFLIAPNPVTNQIVHIYFKDNQVQKLKYTLVNALGQLIAQGAVHPDNSINVANVATGVYVLQLQNESNEIYSSKLIIK